MFDILLGFQLHSALFRWKMATNAKKRHELQVFDLTDRHISRFKAGYLRHWARLWRVRKHHRTALHR